MTREVQAQFDRSTLRERSTAFVREQIVSGALRPGQHVKEVDLSQSLGISRGTVRESLRPLESEGLLASDGRGHMLVRQLSSAEVFEVFEVREALEVLAATKLARHPDSERYADDLRAMLSPLREPGIPFSRQIELDIAFHARLCELTGSTTLVSSWSRLIGQIEMIIVAAGPQRASDRMRYQEHVAIAEAIGTGDVDHVTSVVSSHMRDFSSRYVDDAVADEVSGAVMEEAT